VNIEGFGNFASDSQYSQIHTGFGLGLAYAAGIPWGNATNTSGIPTNRVQLLGRVGFAFDDSPGIISGNATGPIVGANASGSPEFSLRPAVSYTVEVRLPVQTPTGQTSYGCISVGGTVYQFLGSAPDQWAMYAAYSIDPSKVLSALLNIGGK
jgi:hypothetical protein